MGHLEYARLRHVSSDNNSKYINIDDIHKLTRKDAHCQFSCLHINIHSLPSKFDHLKTILDKFDKQDTKLDFILLCETFLNDQNTHII